VRDHCRQRFTQVCTPIMVLCAAYL
jgi:hypothetical protein